MPSVPKPAKRTESEQVVERLTKAWARRDRWRAKAIAKAKWKPRPKVKARNELRIARKAKAYRTVIASAFHKELRYVAYTRSNGFCECHRCAGARRHPEQYDERAREVAITEILCWFTKKGGADFERFRSKDGELHHLNYRFFGEANWAELDVVQWVHKDCHRRIEAEHSTRRRFLTGK